MADPRVQQAKERAERIMVAAKPLPLFGLTREFLMDTTADVLFLADRVAELETALQGVRERSTEDGPCWCPDWRWEDIAHLRADERVHHEACERARTALAGSAASKDTNA